MPIPATRVDILEDFVRRIAAERDLVPIPLVATRIQVAICGGLATVTTERTFRNAEKRSIEATMTFPLPIDATLCALTARIGRRKLKAVAEISDEARDQYEDAISRGKSAVLHEELLKGIHMLSVGHVTTGRQIVVCDTWTAPLSFVDATPRLRIPTTVGDIYGCSPLGSDDIVVGDAVHKGSISIACESGRASLVGAGAAQTGEIEVRFNRPIDIVVEDWKEKVLEGRSADGKKVTLDIKPTAKADTNLDVGILFDRSGSMAEAATGAARGRKCKFDVAKAALLEISRTRLKASDRVHLWEFNDQVEFVGEADGGAAPALLARLQAPDGGTEMGQALEAVIRSAKTDNLIVVTDGKSWAFDPQIAASAMRVTAVLIGEDALEARIAHLAANTGGQVFVATGSDAGAAIEAAFDAARLPHEPPHPIQGEPVRVEVLRRGARVVATWAAKTSGKSKEAASAAARQIGATAAALAVPLLPERQAAMLAKSEGIVTHLTSLVLVDEKSTGGTVLPARRRVPLERRRLEILRENGATPQSLACAMPARSPSPASVSRAFMRGPLSLQSADEPDGLDSIFIDWDSDPEALRQGDLSRLNPDDADEIRIAAQSPAVVALAASLGIDPVVVVLALLAHLASWNRSAKRLTAAVIGAAPATTIAQAMTELGI